jgi:hypothetical protein
MSIRTRRSEPWTKTFLRAPSRAGGALRPIVDTTTAERWLDGFTNVVAADAFVLTLNYYAPSGRSPHDPCARQPVVALLLGALVLPFAVAPPGRA